jgi:DNA-binding CsgD family transcriptional regulator
MLSSCRAFKLETTSRRYGPLKSNPQTMMSRSTCFSFLNRLPTTGNTLTWITQFREALLLLFEEVDHMSITVNVDCDLVNPGTYSSSLSVTQHMSEELGVPNQIVTNAPAHVEAPSVTLLADYRSKGYPMERFHDPIAFDYFLQETAYLGTVFLWGEKSKAPISKITIVEFEQLRPFMHFALSDLVSRHHDARPFDRAFDEALHQMTRQAGLSEQEKKIVVLQLYGHTYKAIGKRLFIAHDTVRKHIQSVYRKTGTTSINEVFAKYFTPRIGF